MLKSNNMTDQHSPSAEDFPTTAETQEYWEQLLKQDNGSRLDADGWFRRQRRQVEVRVVLRPTKRCRPDLHIDEMIEQFAEQLTRDHASRTRLPEPLSPPIRAMLADSWQKPGAESVLHVQVTVPRDLNIQIFGRLCERFWENLGIVSSAHAQPVMPPEQNKKLFN